MADNNSSGGRNTPGNSGSKPGRVITMPPERRFPLGMMVAAGLVAAVMIALVIVVVIDVRQSGQAGEPSGVETVEVSSRQHTTEDVAYDQTPAAGGDHDPAWQNCGAYPSPVREENAVHSLEHGAVWISYSPELASDEIDTISNLAREQTYILASPVENQSSPVMATAWGKQLELQSASDPELEQFIRTFRQGPQTPEPGAVCTGGVGTPS